jgi:hypothetical protein
MTEKKPKTRKRYSIATEIGLRLPHSKESLKFIEEWDPDLYEEIKRVKKKEKRK